MRMARAINNFRVGLADVYRDKTPYIPYAEDGECNVIVTFLTPAKTVDSTEFNMASDVLSFLLGNGCPDLEEVWAEFAMENGIGSDSVVSLFFP